MARTPVPSGGSQRRSVLDAPMMEKRVLIHEVSLIQTCLQLTMIIAEAISRQWLREGHRAIQGSNSITNQHLVAQRG
jgi:hypothetical protein